MRKFIIIILSFLTVPLLAQDLTTKRDTVITSLSPNSFQINIYYKSKNAEQGVVVNGQKDGLWRTYWENGNLHTATEYKNGIKNGMHLEIEKSGSMMLEQEFKNNLPDGLSREYASFGRLKSEDHFKAGVLNGIKRVYYDNGKKQEESNWQNGLKEGTTIWFRNNSDDPTLSYTYHQNSLEGEATIYHLNGRIKSKGYYLNNKENGKWLEYDEEGNLINTKVYEDGKLMKEIKPKIDPRKLVERK